MTRPQLIHGDGDIVRLLEEALALARKGEIDGVVICALRGERQGWTGAYRDDTPFPWPRMVTAVADAHRELLTDGCAWQ